jgi:hypothetical protein
MRSTKKLENTMCNKSKAPMSRYERIRVEEKRAKIFLAAIFVTAVAFGVYHLVEQSSAAVQ